MASESSFDIVSKVDRQEIDNALNQTAKELSQRYDFKGTGASIAWQGEMGIEVARELRGAGQGGPRRVQGQARQAQGLAQGTSTPVSPRRPARSTRSAGPCPRHQPGARQEDRQDHQRRGAQGRQGADPGRRAAGHQQEPRRPAVHSAAARRQRPRGGAAVRQLPLATAVCRPEHQDRTGCVMNAVRGYRTQVHARQLALTVASHHQQISSLGGHRQCVCRAGLDQSCVNRNIGVLAGSVANHALQRLSRLAGVVGLGIGGTHENRPGNLPPGHRKDSTLPRSRVGHGPLQGPNTRF